MDTTGRKPEMTRKERVRRSIEHQPIDRVPIHINATKWVVKKLKQTLQVGSDRELLEKLRADIYDMRGIDIHSGVTPRYAGPPNPLFPADWAGNSMSFWGIREFEKETASGWMFEAERPPLAGEITLEEARNYPWARIEWFDFSELKEKLLPWKDFALMASGGSVFQHATFVRGMDYLMMDMCIHPDLAHYVLGRISDFYYAYFERMLQAAEGLIDILAVADDLGMQQSLLISPEMFDEYIAPALKRMADLAHAYDAKFLLHTCGNIEALIPRFIELGVDVLDPIQPEAMNPIGIKERYGADITLRGGVSIQDVVSRKSPEEIRSEVKRIAEALKKGSGYIFSPGHPVLQDDVPVENILAMYEAGYMYGQTND